MLYVHDIFICKCVKIGLFRDEKANKFIGILNRSFLPGGIRIGKVYRGPKPPGNKLVCRELRSVIRRNAANRVTIRKQQSDNRLRQRNGPFAMLEPRHQQHIGFTFRQCEYGAPLPLSEDQVHLPIAKPRAVGLCRSIVDADTIGYRDGPIRTCPQFVMSVLHVMVGVLREFSRMVGADHAIDRLVRDGYALHAQITCNLHGRPLLPSQQIEGFLLDCRRDGTIAGEPFTTFEGIGMRECFAVMSVAGGVTADFAVDRAGMNADGLGDNFF